MISANSSNSLEVIFSPTIPFKMASQNGTLQVIFNATVAQNYTLYVELLSNSQTIDTQYFTVVPGKNCADFLSHVYILSTDLATVTIKKLSTPNSLTVGDDYTIL
jgi:hypothetical protein